jgi:hypothetical protein
MWHVGMIIKNEYDTSTFMVRYDLIIIKII